MFPESDSNSEKKNLRNAEGRVSRSGKVDKSKIKCYNGVKKGHFALECNKGMSRFHHKEDGSG